MSLKTPVPKLSSSVLPSVLISGASTGIGQCCALRLASQGFQVFAGFRHPVDGQRLEALHAAIAPIALDVTDTESIRQALKTLEIALDGRGLDGLVNNAGIVVSGPLEFVPLDEFRRQLEINVLGHVAMIQTFLPLLRQNAGRIVNMGSVAGLTALPFVAPYSVSKFAMEAITDALRLELKPWGIHVSIIEPGSVATPIWDKSRHASEMLLQAMPPKMMTLYGDAMSALQNASLRSAGRGIHPNAVADAVIHALTARRPRTRYPVGLDSRMRRVFNYLPDRLKDWIILRKVGLPDQAKY